MEYYILKCYQDAKDKCQDVKQGFNRFTKRMKMVIIFCPIIAVGSCVEMIITMILRPEQLWYCIGIIALLATIILLVYVDNSEKKKSMDEYVGTQKKKLEILDDILQNKFNIKNKEKVENLISIYQEYIDNETNKEKKRDKSIVAGFSALGGILTVTLENMELIGIGLDKWLYLAVFLFIFVVEAGITIYMFSFFDSLKRKYERMTKDLRELLLIRY